MSKYLKIRSDSRIFKINDSKLNLKKGDQIVVETEQCQEVALVLDENQTIKDSAENSEEVVVIRKLTEKDKEDDNQKKEEAQQNLKSCSQIIEKHDLPMSLIDADLSLDGKKLTFYFFAPNRVDFRSLVSELASTFKKLIRLQQVGARDRARACGGVGRCGQGFCCKKFLKGDLECVSTDMAYDQGLGQMGSNRVTGACGKLMCCLRYELDFYKKAKGKLPEIGSKIRLKKGTGTVIAHQVLEGKFTVEFEDRTTMEVDCQK